ncbi:hypothetical protein L3X38_042927 [Prunus dulcis]|uniref:Uncharacterized protein n=1 Tax=Prunus dulcis TaxID=3755 RepID=A0AAD4UX73_PRUDU|nr:hypothetical protein L3X38_042927 [Prunus dulcis]
MAQRSCAGHFVWAFRRAHYVHTRGLPVSKGAFMESLAKFPAFQGVRPLLSQRGSATETKYLHHENINVGPDPNSALESEPDPVRSDNWPMSGTNDLFALLYKT